MNEFLLNNYVSTSYITLIHVASSIILKNNYLVLQSCIYPSIRNPDWSPYCGVATPPCECVGGDCIRKKKIK